MALVKVTLIESILKLNGGTDDAYPYDQSDAVLQWGTAIYDYTKTIIPASTTQETSKERFMQVLSTYSIEKEDGLTVLSSALVAHAQVLATGMVGFVGIPPIGRPSFEPVKSIGLAGASSQQCAQLIADIIDTWYRTGKANPLPSGPTVPWS